MFYTLEITKRVDLQHSQHKKKWQLYDMMEVSAKAYDGDHLYTSVPNQYFVDIQLKKN